MSLRNSTLGDLRVTVSYRPADPRPLALAAPRPSKSPSFVVGVQHMDGKRVQDHWSSEVDALVRTYKQFETLIQAPTGDGAQHRGEDGR
jgi:hypothetical protein